MKRIFLISCFIVAMFAFSEWNRLAPSPFLMESGPEFTEESEPLSDIQEESEGTFFDSFSEMFATLLVEEEAPEALLDSLSEMFVVIPVTEESIDPPAAEEEPASAPIAEETTPAQNESFLDSFSEMFVAPSSADESNIYAENEKGSSSSSYPYPMPLRLWFSDTERKGIGYKGGYSTIGLLLGPSQFTGNYIQMADFRGHHIHMDNHIPAYAFNGGLVARYVVDSLCRMFGGNIYYDYRQGVRGGYNRVGLGAEVLGTEWDFRFNGYIVGPVNRKKKCVYDHFTGGFKATFRSEEIAYQGFNAEVGYLAAEWKGFLAYVAGGPYYLTSGSEGRAWGGLFRIRPQYKDYIALDLSISHDHLFNTNYQAKFILSWPIYKLGKRNDRESRCFTDRQLFQPVERFEIIPLKNHCGWKTNW